MKFSNLNLEIAIINPIENLNNLKIKNNKNIHINKKVHPKKSCMIKVCFLQYRSKLKEIVRVKDILKSL